MKARLKEIGNDPLYADERAALEAYADLLEQQTEAKAKRKAAQEDLDRKIDAKYPKLTEAEIKTLVVDDKWMAALAAAVQGELDRVSQTLTGRIRQLAERYATPLPKLTDEVATLAARVDEHLKKMGAYGSEARIQTDRCRRHPGGVGRRAAWRVVHSFERRQSDKHAYGNGIRFVNVMDQCRHTASLRS